MHSPKGSPPPLKRACSDYSADDKTESLQISTDHSENFDELNAEERTESFEEPKFEEHNFDQSDLDTTGSTIVLNRS